MLEKIEKMVKKAQEIANIISNSDIIRIVSHYDADGISSAAIMVKVLRRLNKKFHLTFVNQLDEKMIKKLSKEDYPLILFLDIGSGQLDAIGRHLNGKIVIISDHHQIQGSSKDGIIHLNPMEFGIEDDISGSGVTYMIGRSFGEENKDLSEFAIIGAIGDAQTGSIGNCWGVIGLNKEILKDAVISGKVKVDKGLRIYGRYTRPVHKALEHSFDPYIPGITGSESKSVQFLKDIGIELKHKNGKWRTLSDLSENEQKNLASYIIVERMKGNVKNPDWIFGDIYELLDKKKYRDASEFATILNAFSKLKMSYLGLSLCLNVDDVFDLVDDVLKGYRKELGKAINLIENGKIVKKTKNAYYILARDKISEHIISNATSIVCRSIFTDIPVFSFAQTEDNRIKVSARVPDPMVKNGLKINEIVSECAKMVGGEGGGHIGAAGATIPLGSEDRFIKLVEQKLNIFKGCKKHKTKVLDLDGKEKGNKKGKKVEGKGLVRYFSPKSV